MSAPATRAFMQVDVFTDSALLGNPLAVVLDADDLDATRMQAFARWTNLSETTFLLKATVPDADYRVRIFTPGGELPFAGHPTLGSCHAWLAKGGRPRCETEVVQECGVGLVRIRRAGTSLEFAAPPSTRDDVDARLLADVLSALGLAPRDVQSAQWLDNGPRWLGLYLRDADCVLAIEPDHAELRALPKVGVVGAYPAGSSCAFEVRAFAASMGVPEDPVTGSLNASLAQWLIAIGAAPAAYEAAQGSRMQRRGRVSIAQAAGHTWVGGSVVTVVEGHVTL